MKITLNIFVPTDLILVAIRLSWLIVITLVLLELARYRNAIYSNWISSSRQTIFFFDASPAFLSRPIRDPTNFGN